MNERFMYPEIIIKIQEVCKKHILGFSSSDELQKLVQVAESKIVSLEEKDIRIFFTNIEGELELVKFTIDEEKQFSETKKIAEKILTYLNKR